MVVFAPPAPRRALKSRGAVGVRTPVRRDQPEFFATGVVLINLLIDLIYAVLDPRVRFD